MGNRCERSPLKQSLLILVQFVNQPMMENVQNLLRIILIVVKNLPPVVTLHQIGLGLLRNFSSQSQISQKDRWAFKKVFFFFEKIRVSTLFLNDYLRGLKYRSFFLTPKMFGFSGCKVGRKRPFDKIGQKVPAQQKSLKICLRA